MMNDLKYLILSLIVIQVSYSQAGELARRNHLRNVINEANANVAREYLAARPEEAHVKSLIKRLADASHGIYKIQEEEHESNRPILLIAQGLYIDEGYEWYQPFSLLYNHPREVYFHVYNNRRPLRVQKRWLRESLNQLLREYPSREIVIIGFSAGGMISLELWSEIHSNSRFQNVRLVTVAAPISGYDMPRIGRLFVAPVLGRLTSQIAFGRQSSLNGRSFERCIQYVTSSCDLDVHACSHGDVDNPQLLRDMPCSEVVISDIDTHHSMLTRAIRDYISED